MDAMLEQCVRAHELRPEWFRNFQRYLQTEIQPKLDELEALKAGAAPVSDAELVAEVGRLKAEIDTLKAQIEAQPVKRRRGRPRKAEAVTA